MLASCFFALSLLGSSVPVRSSVPRPAEPEAGDQTVLLLVPSSAGRLEGLRATRWTESELEPLAPALSDHAAGSLVLVDTRCTAGALLAVSAHGWIAPPLRLSSERCGSAEPIELEWLSAGTLRGKVTVPKGEVVPPLGRLRVDRCPAAAGAAAAVLGDYPARIAEDGSWSAEVPAGCIDLRLAVPPFAPVRWTAVELRHGAETAVRDTALVRGGSMTVLVTAPDSNHGVAGAAVHLIPEQRLAVAAEAAYRRVAVPSEREVATDVRGWARFDGIAAGVYYLIAEAPPGGDVSLGVSESFELAEGDAAVVEVSLNRPASLRVELLDVEEARLSPGRLSVELLPQVGSETLYGVGRRLDLASPFSAVFEGLEPGVWRVELMWSASGLGYSLADREIVLAPGTAETLSLEGLSPVYRGRVTLRDQPVAGMLVFRSESERPAGGPVMQCESDEEGSFAAPVSEPGRYTLWFYSEDERFDHLSASVSGVLFEDPRDLVEVKLPNGRIEGVVVDEDGEPVPDIHVGASAIDLNESGDYDLLRIPLEAGARAGADGRFALEALAKGEWELTASRDSLKSESARVSLARDEAVSGVRLVVRETLSIEVVVISEPGEPVRGAILEVFLPISDPGGFPGWARFETDQSGRAELESKPSLVGRSATVAVRATGYARTIRRVPLASRMQIVLSQLSGRLEVVPDGPWSYRDSIDLTLVSSDGAAVSLQTLAGDIDGPRLSLPWPGSTGAFVVPDLAPGSYRLVRLARTYADMVALYEGHGHRFPALATFTVQSGGTTRIEIAIEDRSRTSEDREPER